MRREDDFEWSPLETSKHQDHIIAHVIGATALGYVEFDQAAQILLDIGFIWTIYVDGEMGLLTQSLAINELDTDANPRAELLADVNSLHEEGVNADSLARLTPAPVGCLITEVSFYAHDDRRRVLITGEQGSLVVETQLQTGEIDVGPIRAEEHLA